MNQIIAYLELNMRILLKNRLPFVWSVILPAIFLFLNKNTVLDEAYLGYWWSYIIVSAYLFGISLSAIEQREYGTLKTIFSIKKSPFIYFLGNLSTQIIYILLCLIAFNLFAFVLLHYNFLRIMFAGIRFAFMSIPVAFLGYNLTLIKKIHANTASTSVNIIMFVFLVMMGMDTGMNRYNPLIILTNTLLSKDLMTQAKYLAVCTLLISISMPSIVKFEAVSNERR